MRDQMAFLNRGLHMVPFPIYLVNMFAMQVCACPGRLEDMLNKKKFNFDICKVILIISGLFSKPD